MLLFANRIIGMEISREGIGCALLKGGKPVPLLERLSFLALPPGALQLTRHAPQLSDPELFVQQLETAVAGLETDETRVALTLPDAVGRVVLLDLDETWKNRAEAADMIRWKLKKSLSLETEQQHLDFQVVRRTESGTASVLVAFVARPIIEQYDTLLQETGLQLASVDFALVALMRAFAAVISDEGVVACMTWYNETLGIVLMHDGIPVFWRSKYLPGERADGERVDQELHGSLAAYRKQWPAAEAVRVYCFAPAEQQQGFSGMVSLLWEQVPLLLDSGRLFQQPAELASEQAAQACSVSAAIAAAVVRV